MNLSFISIIRWLISNEGYNYGHFDNIMPPILGNERLVVFFAYDALLKFSNIMKNIRSICEK